MTSLQEKRGGGRLVPFSHLPITYSGSSNKRRFSRDVPKPDSGCPQQGPPPSDGRVAPLGGLRQDNSLEGSSRSGPNGNDSQEEGRNICIPFPHPAAAAIDVITVVWNRWNQLYVFPPKTFMMQLFPKLLLYQYHGVLVAPWHPSAPWFPALFKRAENHLHLRVQLVRSESLKWLPKLRMLDHLLFLKRSLYRVQRCHSGQLSSPHLREIPHKPGRHSLEGI